LPSPVRGQAETACRPNVAGRRTDAMVATIAIACLLCGGLPDGPDRPARCLYFNRMDGIGWSSQRVDANGPATFNSMIAALGRPEQSHLAWGASFIWSYLDGDPDRQEEVLRALLASAEATSVPVLITLDGQNWWGGRPDLWNWWDASGPGFDPANAWNVEWAGPGPERAVRICWRNWGRQTRVLPPPNLMSPPYRAACEERLRRLVPVILEWARALPPGKRHLFGGIKLGWEASIGVNAFYYLDGNAIMDRAPDDPSGDPIDGYRIGEGVHGGLAPLGFAALASEARARGESYSDIAGVSLADHERIVHDYLVFLARTAHELGAPRAYLITHCGGTYPPWEKHYSFSTGITDHAVPGFSFYGQLPESAGDLGASLDAAGVSDWAAAEWNPMAVTGPEWERNLRKTFGYRDCRAVVLYNWERGPDAPRPTDEALEGLRALLAGPGLTPERSASR